MTTAAAADNTAPASLDDAAIAVLNRGNLKDQIASALRTEIVAGRMRPGTTYKMGELAARFGASRTPMREAILELEAKGLVEITRGVGFRVLAPSAKELRDNLEVREMLEAPAMASLAARLTDEELATARGLAAAIEEAAKQNDLARYLERDREFHLYLMARTGNGKLVAIVGELRDVQRVPGLDRMAHEGSLVERNRHHVAMLDAIESGDGGRVEQLVREHLALESTGVGRVGRVALLGRASGGVDSGRELHDLHGDAVEVAEEERQGAEIHAVVRLDHAFGADVPAEPDDQVVSGLQIVAREAQVRVPALYAFMSTWPGRGFRYSMSSRNMSGCPGSRKNAARWLAFG